MSIEYDQGWRYIVWVDGIDDYFVHYQDAKDEYDGWIDGAIKNLSDVENINVNAQLFKKQNDLSHRESIFYNYLFSYLYRYLVI